MDKHIIGENAGIVWTLLSDGQRWEYEDLKVRSKLSDRDLSAAIGWLAREDKIFFETDGCHQKEYVSLCVNFFF